MSARRLRKWACLTLAILCLSGHLRAVLAQKPPPVVLEVDLENFVQYWDDSTDPSKLVSVPNRTTTAPRVFMQNVWVADVVAVNGKPARGTYVNRTQSFSYRPSPMAGQTIADINRNGGPSTDSLEILHSDGTPIGTIMGMGLVAGTPPPGSPAAMRFGNTAIVGGTGAFLGIRGQCGIAMGANIRNASQTEDPSLRRVHGGGTMQMVLYVIPMFRPEIIASASGPAVFHADFTPVTSDKPARKGETLIVYGRDLGPTSPSVDPGDPFPQEPFAVVTSPVDVLVDGKTVPSINQIGVPGTIDNYRVDFQLPAEISAGMIPIQLSAAWIKGAPVRIPVH